MSRVSYLKHEDLLGGFHEDTICVKLLKDDILQAVDVFPFDAEAIQDNRTLEVLF